LLIENGSGRKADNKSEETDDPSPYAMEERKEQETRKPSFA
jgi:hypothetical protein